MRPYFAVLTSAMLASAMVAGAQTPVRVTRPEAASAVRTLDLSGSFVARRSARLSPRLSGLVAAAPVDVGDYVALGDVVLRLDERLAELQLAEERAAREEAAARLVEAERLAAEARRLAADRFVAETQIAAREADVGIAQAALAVAEAAVATARERLLRHRVIAPFDGVIAERLSEAGEWVQTGTPVAELVATDSLWLDVRAPQQYYIELNGDVTAAVRVDALEREWSAEIHRRVPVSDPAARTFLIRLVLAEPVPGIVPGMSASVRLQWSAEHQVVYLHRDAIIRFPDGTTTVWTIENEGGSSVARERVVTVSRYQGDQVEISAGIGPDALVVVRGNELLVEGEAVRVREDTP